FYGLKPYIDPVVDKLEEKEPEMMLSGRRVLLAEDNELNWEIAEELLSEEGLALDWAENGQLCVEMFERAEQGYYDAILMDLRMPVMTGYEATHVIRAMDRQDAKEIPIIAMTADAFAEDVQKCLDAGMNAHVPKPIDVRDVCRQLLKFMKPK
ncbi:MAG: response regulator, partial [Lachnospiraceae bacterium]|nr:response regulator [Lachnospiraceae bacterium]